jgi:hypothetical protein
MTTTEPPFGPAPRRMRVGVRVGEGEKAVIVGGRHQPVDFVLPYGRVLHDYLA